MITVRFIHPGSGAEVSGSIPTFCPRCLRDFEPDSADLQTEVGAPVHVHCPGCGELALSWAPPVPAPPAADEG